MLLGLKGTEVGHLEADPRVYVNLRVLVLTTQFLPKLTYDVVHGHLC